MPTSPDAAVDSGQKLLLEGRPAQASALLFTALRKDPEHPWLLLYAGLAQVEEGQGDAGLALIQQAMDLMPQNAILRSFYARALYDTGEYDQAVEECQKVEAAQPGHPGARTLQLLCLSHTRPLDALRAMTLEEMPDGPHLQGRALHRAEQLLAGAAPLEPLPLWSDQLPWVLPPGSDLSKDRVLNAAAFLKLAEKMKSYGMQDRAIAFTEAAMRQESDEKTQAQLAILYFEAARYAEVEAALRKYDVDDPGRNAYLGISLFHLGRPTEAISALERANLHQPLEMPTDGLEETALHTLGQAYLRTGQEAEARRAFIRTAAAAEYLPAARIAAAYLHCRAAALSEPPTTPVASEPVASEPVASEPVASEPVASESVPPEPAPSVPAPSVP